MIGITSPTTRTNRPERGHHVKPLRCTDDGCPSRTKCLRPDNPGEDHNFKHNRGTNSICAYFTAKRNS